MNSAAVDMSVRNTAQPLGWLGIIRLGSSKQLWAASWCWLPPR